MAKLIDYPLMETYGDKTQMIAIIPGTGTNFTTVRVSRAAVQTYVNQLIQDSVGPAGKDGREVELANNGTNIVWRYVGETTWKILVPLADLKGDKGDPGNPGAPGTPGEDGAPGTPGTPGAPGAAATIEIGTVSTGAAGSQVSVTNTGTNTAARFNFSIPKGDKGDAGNSATVAVGTTSTGLPGSSATVTNVGTTSAAVFNFTIPKGDKGDKGDPGAKGADGTNGVNGDPGIPGTPGAAATVSVGATNTGAAGTNATVTNTGTANAAVLEFTIPRGSNGNDGAPGIAATVEVGTVTTGAAGTQATITNVGTANAARLNFTIPKGDPGTAGEATDTASNIHNATAKATPVDTDEFALVDSMATWSLKKLTWANIKNALASVFLPKTGGDIAGNINLTGAARRITGDFSNSTISNRTLFQTNVTNAATGVWAAPTGAGSGSLFGSFSDPDPENSSFLSMYSSNSDGRITAGKTGTGAYAPMTFYVGGAERFRIGTDGSMTFSGNLSFGNSGRITGDFSNTTLENRLAFQTTTPNALSIVGVIPSGTGTISGFRTHGGTDPGNASVGDLVILGGSEVRLNSGATGTGSYLPMTFFTNGIERARINVDGKVGFGTNNPVMAFTASNTAMTGGAPLTSGTGNDPNCAARIQGGSVALDFGTYAAGDSWIQSRLFTDYTNMMPIRLNPNGGAVYMSPSGFGHTDGAGASVVQESSKGTAVTINKMNGRILTSNAALASQTTTFFRVNNSMVGQNDHIILTLNNTGGVNGTFYNYWTAIDSAGGGFYICLKNISSNSLSNSLAFNFIIIKGSAA